MQHVWDESINTLKLKQNGRHFADDTLKCIFLDENIWISINISLKFVPKGPVNNIPVLVQIMAWRQPSDKLLSEPMMVSLLMHKCIIGPQQVKCCLYPGADKRSHISPTGSRMASSRAGSQRSRPQSTRAEAIAKRRREQRENMEEAAMELLAHFNHRNLESLLKVTRNTLEQLRKRITTSSMVHYIGGKLHA